MSIRSTDEKKTGVNLTNNVQDLSAENYKVLLKEIKEALNNWREMFMSWKIQHSICIKIRLFCRYKIILKLLWKGKIE